MHFVINFLNKLQDPEKKLTGRELLSDFQQDKFRYFFYHVLDLNSDHVISEEDFDSLNDRVRNIFQKQIVFSLEKFSTSLLFCLYKIRKTQPGKVRMIEYYIVCLNFILMFLCIKENTYGKSFADTTWIGL